MKQEYIITNEELSIKGLDLNDYALSGSLIPAIINRGLDGCITRCCKLYDGFTEQKIEEYLDNHQELVPTFKKLQYNFIYNLIFFGEETPINEYIDAIITHELAIGKINGIQKGLYYSNR